jgi:hypothetical protein
MLRVLALAAQTDLQMVCALQSSAGGGFGLGVLLGWLCLERSSAKKTRPSCQMVGEQYRPETVATGVRH